MKKTLFMMLACTAMVAPAMGAGYSYEEHQEPLSGNSLSSFLNSQPYASVTFKSNTAESDSASVTGGAIKSSDGSDGLEFKSNSRISFSSNEASSTYKDWPEGYAYGGAIYTAGSLTFTSNEVCIIFNSNSTSSDNSYAYGGAIYTVGSLTFTSNTGDSKIKFNSNTTTANFAKAMGGAVYTEGTTTFANNTADIEFSENKATGLHSSGGAISVAAKDALGFTGNNNITFSGNTASSKSTNDSSAEAAEGGAIYTRGATTFSQNGDITFSGNTASSDNSAAQGGAIFSEGIMAFSQNGAITFSDNKASSGADGRDSYGLGGAIYVNNKLTFANSKDISFSGNTASGNYMGGGGAVYANKMATTAFNSDGLIKFSENKAIGGERATGGAICATGNLTIQGSALFEKNTEVTGTGTDTTYRLRSIYQIQASDEEEDALSFELSAATDKEIKFSDSIYSNASKVSLNKDFTKSDGTTAQTASGTIRFTGATTEADLKAMKGGTEGTDEEIANSRTSELEGDVTIYGGKLIVEEKAILNIGGTLTTKTGSSIEVSTGAQLNLAKADITMPSLTLSGGTVTLGTETDHAATLTTTTLTVTDDSALNANLVMTSGTLTFSAGAVLTMGCSVTIGDGVVVVLDDEVISALASGSQTSLTLFESAEDINIGEVIVQNSKGETAPSNVKLEAKGGTIIATPEPATATLSLLALARLCARRRRLR